MRKFLLVLTLLAGLLFLGFAYQQGIVEGSFGPAAMVGTAVLGLLFATMATLWWLAGTRHRDLVGKILLAGVTTVVCYFIVDVGAGLILIKPLSPPLVPDAYRHHALVPDSYSELRQRDFAYIQRVNHFGLRGPDITLEKPAGTKRLLMLGDSFTMGKGVQDEETFSRLVEAGLNRALQACGGPAVQVLNGGVDSYAPVLSRLQLERDLTKLAPDFVMLNLDNSDLVQEAAYRRQAVRDSAGRIVAVPQVWQESPYERFRSWTARHLFFTRVLLVYANRAMDHKELTVREVVNEAGRGHFAHTLEGDVDRTTEWHDIFESLAGIKAHTDSLGIPFVLTTYPWAHQLGEKGWDPGRYEFMQKGEKLSDLTARTIRHHADSLGIALLETEPTFRAYTGDEVLYFAYDPHWTPAGQRLMAQAIEQYLVGTVVPQWCGTK